VSAQRRIAGIVAVACFVAGGIGVPDAVAAAVPGAPGRAPRAKAPAGFPVPARPGPGAAPASPLIWLTAAQTTGGGVSSDHGALQTMASARRLLTGAQKLVRRAQARVVDLRADIKAAHARLTRLARARRTLIARARTRAIAVYIDGTSSLDQFLPETSTVAEAGRRSVYANASQDVDSEHLDRVVDQQADGRRALAGLEDQLGVATTDLAQARSALSTALRTFVAVQSIIADPTHGGRVFPVDGAFNFSDSWNAYRAHGGDKTNAHHATDIMARRGTPVVAIESGKIDKIGWNRLGGWRLWIAGASGTRYYYAHLRAYAPGLRKGSTVVAGQYLGRVGRTGNASGGPTHLHFEVHLPGDLTVNPYPLLCLLAGAPVPLIPPSEPKAPATKPAKPPTAKPPTAKPAKP
jgi:murein DD-endopeptidase MepM/ murein hydrolase activator NlpD